MVELTTPARCVLGVPAPKLSRTPGLDPRKSPTPGGDTHSVLLSYGFSEQEVLALVAYKSVVSTEATAIGGSKL